MAALLNVTEITALEARRDTYESIAGQIQTVLNGLTDPADIKHEAFGELVDLHRKSIEAFGAANRVLLKNDNAYGKT